MKKNVTRIFATAGAVVALVFVIVLLVAVFGGITEAEFDNSLVKGLFIALAIIFILLTAVTLALLFINDELIKEIVLSSGKDGGTTITVSDVKKKTKQTVALVEGVKCTKCVVVDNEYGVRLKITVKVKQRDIKDIENYVRAMLEDAFRGAYNFAFHSIEIRVKKLESKYQVDAQEIIRKADEEEHARREEEERQAALKEAEEAADNLVNAEATEDEIVSVETSGESAEEEVVVSEEKTDEDNEDMEENLEETEENKDE